MAQILLPPAPQREPEKKKKDPLEDLFKGLAVANSVLGVVGGVQNIGLRSKQIAALERAEAKEKRVTDAAIRKEEREIALQTAKLVQEGFPIAEGQEAALTLPGPKKTVGFGLPDVSQKIQIAREDRIDEVQEIFNKNTNVQANLAKFQSAKGAEATLRSGNPVTIEAVKTQILRGAGEKGTLSDKDIKRAGGSPELAVRISRFFKQTFEGEMQPEDRDNFIKFAQLLQRQAANNLRNQANQIAAQKVSDRLQLTQADILDSFKIDEILQKLPGTQTAFRPPVGQFTGGATAQAAGREETDEEFVNRFISENP